MENIKRFFAAPVFDDEDKTRTAELVNAVLISVTLLVILAIVGLVLGKTTPLSVFVVLITLLIALQGLQIPLRRGHVKAVGIIVVVSLTTAIAFSIAAGGTVRAPAISMLVLIILIAGLTISRRAAYWTTAANIFFVIALVYAEYNKLLPPPETEVNIQQVILFSVSAILTVYLLSLALERIETSLALAKHNQKTLETLNISLEERISNATHNLTVAAEVGRNISRVSNLDSLLKDAVELIQNSFNLYYAQIYLTDRIRRNLVLRAGTGQVGEKLLNRGHRLPIDMGSINGTAAVERQAVIVENTESSRIHRANPLLPDTRSEMAIPLITQERVVGVLDLQSSETNALNIENLPAFEALAGQLAVTIVNAELFAEIEQSRAQIEQRSRQMVSEGWENFLDGIKRSERVGYTYTQENITPLLEPLPANAEENMLVVPIQVSGASVGKLQFEGKQEWDTDDTKIVSTIAEQVAQQIENLRLLEQAKQYQEEAQETLRRLTREGWQRYQEENFNFIYKDNQVQAADTGEDFGDQAVYEIKISDETIGLLGIEGAETLSAEDITLVASVTEQLSAQLENLRLNEKTEQALSETESLYNASREITAARDMDEVANTLVKYIDHSQLDRVVVAFIDENVKSEILAEVRAIWDRAGKLKAGNTFTSTQMPVLHSLGSNDILVVDDFSTTTDVDEASKAVFAYLEVKSAAIIPISVGEILFGWILLETTRAPRKFSAVDMNPFAALAGQAGVVLESQRLLQQSQNRAKREQALSKITSAIRSSTDPRTILRTTVRELGTVLGRRAMIQMTTQTEEKPEDK